MTLEQAKQMCESFMRHHGVYDYKFEFLQRRKKYNRAGQCDYKRKVISLQPTFVEKNYPVVIKWTILHEIAHAIAGRKHGHNKFWKRTAIALGDDGQRCYGNYVKK